MASVALRELQQRVLKQGVSVAAVLGGFAAFVVVRGVLRHVLRPRPFGPFCYYVRQQDSGINPVLRAFLGDFAPLVSKIAGESHVRYTNAARAALGDRRAHAVFYSGTAVRVLLTNPGDVHFVFVQQGRRFVKSRTIQFLEPLLGKNGLITIRDEDYHAHQVRNVSRAISPAAVKNIAATTMREQFALMIETFRTKLAECENDPKYKGWRLVINGPWNDATLSIISESAFRTTNFAPLRALMDEGQVVGLSPLVVLGPTLYRLLPTRAAAKTQVLRDAITVVSRKIIAEARSKQDEESDEEANPGSQKKLIDLLAENRSLTEDEITDHALTFVLAGHETTATTLNWMSYLLATHPAAQETLAEELRCAFPQGTTPTLDTVKTLPYLQAVMLETLRYIPPTSSLTRESTEDTFLPVSGTFLPKGTMVVVPQYVLLRDPTVFGDDAEEFRPERWIRDPDLRERAGVSFITFGAGSRSCIGRDFALAEMALGAAMMYRNFEVVWPADEPEPVRVLGIVTRPKHPFHVVIRRRVDA